MDGKGHPRSLPPQETGTSRSTVEEPGGGILLPSNWHPPDILENHPQPGGDSTPGRKPRGHQLGHRCAKECQAVIRMRKKRTQRDTVVTSQYSVAGWEEGGGRDPPPWSSLRVLGLPGHPLWPTRGAPGLLSPPARSGAGESSREPPRVGIFPTVRRKRRSGRRTQTSPMRPAGRGGSARFRPPPSFLVGGHTSAPGAGCFRASVGLGLGGRGRRSRQLPFPGWAQKPSKHDSPSR